MMHVDEEGSSPDMPLGDSLLAFRVQAMPGGFTRFSYRTATGDEDRQVIDVSEVLEKTMSTSKSDSKILETVLTDHLSPQVRGVPLPYLHLINAQYSHVEPSTTTLDAQPRYHLSQSLRNRQCFVPRYRCSKYTQLNT